MDATLSGETTAQAPKQTTKEYKSPPHALIWFFRKSRDLWKSKYQLEFCKLRLALESWCAKIGGIHKIGWMLFRSTALWGGGFAYLIDKTARRMHLPSYP